NNFVGTLAARGGSSANVGGAGSIYTKPNAQSVGLFTIDNGGAAGAAATSVLVGGADLSLLPGAVVTLEDTSVLIRNLLIQSNAWLFVSNRNSSFTISINVTFLAGGGITADGTGFTGGQGQGAGRSGGIGIPTVGSGAGHGGGGGNASNSVLGGLTY